MADKLAELAKALEDLKSYQRFNRLAYYTPYPSDGALRVQRLFHANGATDWERMLQAGNQEGKTYCAAAEVSMHLTGRYPNWWVGKVFPNANDWWVCGEGSLLVRDTSQTLLCGKPGVDGEFGTGFIPRDAFADKPSLSRGVTDAYDTLQVRHGGGGDVQADISLCSFKSYDQGRVKFQGKTLTGGAWCDEEPEYEIYSEILTRVAATGGHVLVTFTPLKGKTPLLTRFTDERAKGRSVVIMTIYDAEHFTPEQRAEKIASWPAHEREARSMGIPMMGEGRVFPFADDTITEDPIINVPPEWTRLWGIDFGSGGNAHPFAAVLTLWDRETDTIHVHAAMKTGEPLVSQHCALVKQVAAQVRVAWPHDGNAKERGANDETMTTAKLYKRGGLMMLGSHATFPDGGISTEAGITEMYERMRSGKLKVARHLMQGDWGNEFRSYHRKDGLLVKVLDDLMSSTRIAIMARRHGDNSPIGPSIFHGTSGNRQELASGIDFPIF